MDERGFLVGVVGRNKRAFSKRQLNKKRSENLFKMDHAGFGRSWRTAALMGAGCLQASSTLQLEERSDHPGWRLLKLESTKSLSHHLYYAVQTKM